MNTVKSSELKKGNAEIFIPPGKKYHFASDNIIDVFDQNGMRIDLIGKSPGIINIKTGAKVTWCVNYQETNHHPANEVPTEQPIEDKPDMLTRMRALIYEEVANKYGANSEEVETLEEAMNFDLDNDGHIGSPYEIPEDDTFVEEVLAPTSTTEDQQTESATTVEESTPADDPTSAAETTTP